MRRSEEVSLDRYARAVEACAVMNLRQASRVVTAFFDDALRPTGLRATQLNILMAIAVGAPPTVTGLAEVLAMDRTTMTRNLQLLRSRGLIKGDEVALTGAGRRAAARAMPYWERAQATVVEALGGARWRALLGELAAAKAAVRARRRRAAR
jgi:DNA-binding MarR family transcriptional regulator